jgi:mRNA-degrading endonuclease RelE of RelBE toxin-antitoxin system
LANITEVLQTTSFKKTVNKLNKKQKRDLDNAVREVITDPEIGERKKGDLAFLRVHKCKMVKQLTLLGYSYEDGSITLELIALGSHENFYRDVKRTF